MDLAITATGYNTPALTESGTLPSGLRFTSTGNGHAAITGTPAKHTAGSRAITITAANQLGTTSQTFTLTVRRLARHWAGNGASRPEGQPANVIALAP
jgi:Putative Ig domain